MRRYFDICRNLTPTELERCVTSFRIDSYSRASPVAFSVTNTLSFAGTSNFMASDHKENAGRIHVTGNGRIRWFAPNPAAGA